MGWLKSHNYQLKVSPFSVGEFVNIIIRKKNNTKNENMLYDFYNRVKQKDFGICQVEESSLSLFSNLIVEIRRKENRIHATDVLIVAQSMTDADCCGFLTFAGEFHNNVGIDAVVKSFLPDRKFRITDDPRK